ncbi:MAG: glycosyltransferase family 4 protein [Candidatus Thermoplasmatota archaeon]|nr:glycosyltransferase family 4 protein [Candidatus Thermoplasmatota archaeon]
MKIAHVVSYIQPEFGYEEYYSAREQAALGHEVHVITSDRIFPFNDVEKMLADIGSPYKDRMRPLGIEEIEGFTIHRHKTIYEILYDFIVYRGIEEDLRNLRPDVVHAHGLWQWGTHKAARVKDELGFKLIIDEHAYSTTYDQTKNLRNFILDKDYRFFRAPFARKNLKKADEVVAICQETVTFLEEFFGYRNAHMIPLGVDHRKFSFDEKARKEVRKELGVREDEYLLVTAGRLDTAKRLELFIEAVEMLGRDDVKLLVVGRGDGSYLKKLRNMKVKGVSFAGFKRSDELSSLYSAADLGLWGKASITIREAMGCDLPLVLLDEPNMQDLLKWDNGVFVKADAGAISKAVVELLADPERRKIMGERGRKAVEEKLSVEAEAKDLLKVYE